MSLNPGKLQVGDVVQDTEKNDYMVVIKKDETVVILQVIYVQNPSPNEWSGWRPGDTFHMVTFAEVPDQFRSLEVIGDTKQI